ncbi:hypothetical protein D6890_001 [Lactococcus phage D6890]|nr:hypothetical protein D6890_001 [Lactococcus phage D6890]
MGSLLLLMKGGEMAKAKYEEWILEEGLLKIQGWARDGLTEEQIAHNMGIAVSTLGNWKKSHLEILEALKKGKEVVDIQVENALLKRALGYEFVEITKELTDAGLLVTKEVTKQQAPDTTAAIFWLKNRKPNEWRDKSQTELSGGIKVSNPYEGLTEEELRKLANL